MWLGKLAAHLSRGLRGDNESYKGNHGQPGILDLLGLQLLHRMVKLETSHDTLSLYMYADKHSWLLPAPDVRITSTQVCGHT